jgi:hypothetical protein
MYLTVLSLGGEKITIKLPAEIIIKKKSLWDWVYDSSGRVLA